MRFIFMILALLGLLGQAPLMAAEDNRPGCDSCRLQIKSLDKPVKLTGKWLFTRDDNPQNKDVVMDTSTWPIIKAPGPWKGAYADKKNFTVGWYRGNFEFDQSLDRVVRCGSRVGIVTDPHGQPDGIRVLCARL